MSKENNAQRTTAPLSKLFLIPQKEFSRINSAEIDKFQKLTLISDMCRANALMMVKKAGSGHLGSSFSAMDIVVWLYYCEMDILKAGLRNPSRDIYFSSKGHDVPGLYSVLFSLGILSKDKILSLRRINGLDGHPDIRIPGIESNSGSLGMGISKGKGMAWAKHFLNYKGRVFVLTGDGELQEGQIWEALQTTAHQTINNLIVIIDHNKVQTDRPVEEIISLGDLEAKLRAFGWQVSRCNGHDFQQLQQRLREFNTITDKPKILIADTIKGRGVSFMEHPTALKKGKGLYRWHAGAPDDETYLSAYKEIVEKINKHLVELGLPCLLLEEVETESKKISNISCEYVAEAFGQALVEIAAERKDLIVLDADLTCDCRLRAFQQTYPERFIENGIAEQDMVSMAGGLARMGLLPIVNTFAAFLSSRANEQIYNNASERTKIIYICHYSGVIPAGPGKSHQSIRDISLFGALPNCTIIQPCNAAETFQIVRFCVNQATENCMIRLAIGPSPRIIELPKDYLLSFGRGVALTDGCDALLFAYGPVMLHEALLASEILLKHKFYLKVINMPWLNRVDTKWLKDIIQGYSTIYVLEDHAPVGGLGDKLLNELVSLGLLKSIFFKKFAIKDYPECGRPEEVLNYHGVDGASLVGEILLDVKRIYLNREKKYA